MRIKIIGLVAAGLVAVGTLTGCGNMSMGMGNFTFKHAHIAVGGDEGECINLKKWYDNGEGIEVEAADGTGYFLSEGSYILIEEEENCPFCKED